MIAIKELIQCIIIAVVSVHAMRYDLDDSQEHIFL